jgi:hypothetical protein
MSKCGLGKDTVKLRSSTAGLFETKMPELTSFNIATTASGFLPKNDAFKIPVMTHDTTINVEIF